MGTQAPWGESLAQTAGWSLATIMVYLLAKRIYRRWPQWWLMPLAIAPALLVVAALALHESYRDYIRATGWLVALLGPATVAFAVPIYEQRALIRCYWPLLLVGTVVGSLTAVASSWALASLLGVDGPMRLSLLPRSMSTPFAVEVSGEIGGIPDLTAVLSCLPASLARCSGTSCSRGCRCARRSPRAHCSVSARTAQEQRAHIRSGGTRGLSPAW
jgi:putative effector of murein hydrolase